MPHLEKLNLEGNKISAIENLSHLTNLKVLKLGNFKPMQETMTSRKFMELSSWLTCKHFGSISTASKKSRASKLFIN
jgi:hypothetical protein